MPEKREKVRSLLCRYRLSQSWLLCELRKDGISVDKSSLSEILHGRRNRDKAEQVIEGALVILEKYSKYYAEEGE